MSGGTRWRATYPLLGPQRVDGTVPIQGSEWKKRNESIRAVDRKVAEAAYAEYVRLTSSSPEATP